MADDKKNIFRKSSLERLSSPDKLDQLVTVVGPKGWIALYTIIGFVVLTILWSIFGSISVKVQGQGVLLRTGGIHKIPTKVTGQITDIAVTDGSSIRRGDVIARVEQPNLLYEIYLLRQNINDAIEMSDRRVLQFETKRKNLLRQQAAMKERLAGRQTLLKKGLVTRQLLIDTEEKLQSIGFDIDQIPIEINKEQDNIESLKKQLLTKQDELQRNSRIVSPYTGRVVEVKVKVDGFAHAGDNIVGLELEGRTIRDLEAVIYVNSADGKKVRRGMEAAISPLAVKTEEFGSMLGTVVEVSGYAVTRNAMIAELGNEDQVNVMLQQGPMFAVLVHLNTDPNSFSGFEWTSDKGPPTKVDSGSLCMGAITVTKRRPISFVLPFVKNLTGVQ